MNREIKFRFWDKKHNDMTSFESSQSNARFAINHALDSSQFIVLPKHENVVLMQYTGQKDPNGVEIYEGDILAFKREKDFKKEFVEHFEMKWQHEYSSWTQYSPKDRFFVVGNIYQHPHLLREGKF